MVIGIIALLISILLPAVSGARGMAERVRCAATLRELVAASVLHLNDNGQFPDPRVMPATGAVMPASLQVELLNDITLALKKPAVATTDSIDAFPTPLVCPLRNRRDVMRAPDTSFATPIVTPFWQTGYMYVGGLERRPNNGTVVKPNVAAPARGGRRGVLWADTLTGLRTGGTPTGVAYYHIRGPWNFDAATKVSRDTRGFEGQHRGYSDGSVEWTAGRYIDLDFANLPMAAPYHVNLGGYYQIYYVF